MPSSLALKSSSMWELAGEQKQSRSRGPGNNLPPIPRLPGCRCAQRSLALLRLKGERILQHRSPPLSRSACAPEQGLPGAGALAQLALRPHKLPDPPQPSAVPFEPGFRHPNKRGPIRNRRKSWLSTFSQCQKRDMSRKPREERTESHALLLAVVLAG